MSSISFVFVILAMGITNYNILEGCRGTRKAIIPWIAMGIHGNGRKIKNNPTVTAGIEITVTVFLWRW